MRFEPCLLDEDWVKRAARAGRQLGDVLDEVSAVLDDLGPAAPPDTVADALDAVTGPAGLVAKLKRLVQAIRATPTLCWHREWGIAWTQRPSRGCPYPPTRPAGRAASLLSGFASASARAGVGPARRLAAHP